MKVRFQADNDLKFGIVIALRRREASVDFASAQEARLDGLSNAEVLDRAALEGVLVVFQWAPLGDVIDALFYIWFLADPLELRNQAHYLPSFSRHVFR